MSISKIEPRMNADEHRFGIQQGFLKSVHHYIRVHLCVSAVSHRRAAGVRGTNGVAN
jgi:hypothetical protein